jgi:hypothetical protein
MIDKSLPITKEQIQSLYDAPVNQAAMRNVLGLKDYHMYINDCYEQFIKDHVFVHQIPEDILDLLSDKVYEFAGMLQESYDEVETHTLPVATLNMVENVALTLARRIVYIINRDIIHAETGGEPCYPYLDVNPDFLKVMADIFITFWFNAETRVESLKNYVAFMTHVVCRCHYIVNFKKSTPCVYQGKPIASINRHILLGRLESFAVQHLN